MEIVNKNSTAIQNIYKAYSTSTKKATNNQGAIYFTPESMKR